MAGCSVMEENWRGGSISEGPSQCILILLNFLEKHKISGKRRKFYSVPEYSPLLLQLSSLFIRHRLHQAGTVLLQRSG